MKITDKYVFFWKSYLGNWSRVPGGINYEGKNFPTSEHLFMYLKAQKFNDLEAMEAILGTNSPKKAKDIGRRVKGYKENIWSYSRIDAMYTALMARAKCDKKFKTMLLENYVVSPSSWKRRTFVEASPFDTIWGIGLGEDSRNIENEKYWEGQNLLGKTMTRVAAWWLEEERLNTWSEDLIMCPSQIYFEFRDNLGILKTIYLRWRHDDPWTAEVFELDEITREFKYDTGYYLNCPFYSHDDYPKLEEWCLKELGLEEKKKS